MEHFYQDIFGYFSYEYIYHYKVAEAVDGAVFVEIGSFKGKSSSFMAVEIANSNKKIGFICIDPMELMSHYVEDASANPAWDGYNVENFRKTMEPVKDYYILLQMTSESASKQFKNNSIDFIMIDGDHEYEAVKADIINFYPKMKEDGEMWGDDAWAPSIWQAAQDAASELGLVAELVNNSHFKIVAKKQQ